MKQYLQLKYIIPAIVVLIITAVGINKCKQNNDLKCNGSIIQAKITDYLSSHKGAGGVNPNFRCEFYYKGRKRSLISNSKVKEKGISYIGKEYPALYSEKTDAVRLLIFPEDYEEYNLKFPDSLNFN